MIELRQAQGNLLRQSFSGDVFNTAVYFHRTAPLWPSCFVSSVGNDAMSKALLSYTQKQGLNTDLITITESRLPGLYLIQTDQEGERSFFYWRAGSAASQMMEPSQFEVLRQRALECRLLYFSGITLAILDDSRRQRLLELARLVKHHGGWVGFDTNYRPSLWQDSLTAKHWIEEALAAATHALLTFDDEQKLHFDASPGDTMSRVLGIGVNEVVVKLGKDGCLVHTGPSAELQAVPAEVLTPVDTSAAGDSFNAAYLASRLEGNGPVEAAEAGNRLAAKVIMYPGAIMEEVSESHA